MSVRGNRQIRLLSRPDGPPRLEDFELFETEVPEPVPGQVLVENHWMSVDPSTRVMMLDGDRPWAGLFAAGQPLAGYAVGTVLESAVDGYAPGDTVMHSSGWRELALLEAADLADFNKVDPDVPGGERAYLGALGWPGLTAYLGMLEVAGLREGDTVFVSAAAGGVGALAVQLAKRRGHRVVASAGSAEKIAYLRELGADAAFNYRDGDFGELLAAAAPGGVDLYFDLVGGETLKAVFAQLNLGARVTLCGAISTYNTSERACGPDLFDAIGKALTIRGFGVARHAERFPDMRREMTPWLREGSISFPETVVEGLDRAPQALIDLLAGEALGKIVLAIR